MLRLLCGENFLEYAGDGWLQCGRHADCPKKVNNKILGFDCLTYIDNVPEGCKLDIPEEHMKEKINTNTDSANTGVDGIDVGQKADKSIRRVDRTIEYITA